MNTHNHGEAQQTDWESKYREAISHSREWEKRAKDNKAADDELQKLKDANMSEQQKAEARTARLQKELDALKAEKQANVWHEQVAVDTGLKRTTKMKWSGVTITAVSSPPSATCSLPPEGHPHPWVAFPYPKPLSGKGQSMAHDVTMPASADVRKRREHGAVPQ